MCWVRKKYSRGGEYGISKVGNIFGHREFREKLKLTTKRWFFFFFSYYEPNCYKSTLLSFAQSVPKTVIKLSFCCNRIVFSVFYKTIKNPFVQLRLSRFAILFTWHWYNFLLVDDSPNIETRMKRVTVNVLWLFLAIFSWLPTSGLF